MWQQNKGFCSAHALRNAAQVSAGWKESSASQVLGTAPHIWMAVLSRKERLEERHPSKALEIRDGTTAAVPQGSKC